MKNNKGFTLIELLLTIALLAIISIISFVSIKAMIDKNQRNQYTTTINNIAMAAKEYVSDKRYSNDMDEETFTIPVQELITNNYLQSEIINPCTKENESANINVTISLNNDRTVKEIVITSASGGEIFNGCGIDPDNEEETLPNNVTVPHVNNGQSELYQINYILNGGKLGNQAPNTASYKQNDQEANVQISNPTKTVKVTVNTSEGINIEGATIGENTVIQEQTFLGWSSNTNLGLGDNAKTSQNGSTYESWSGDNNKNENFRNLRDNAGTVTMVANWEAVPLIPPEITKTGYTCGWTTDKSSSSIEYESGTTYTPATNSNKTTIELYPVCEQTAYTISYTLNGGTNNSNNPTSYNIESNNITIAAATKTVTITGNVNGTNATIGAATSKAQTFKGWTGSNGTTPQTSVTIAKGSTGDKEYSANWTAVATTLPTVTKTGYTCAWYSTSGNSGGSKVGDSGGTYTPTANSASAITVYARCTPITYTIGYTLNGGANNSNNPTSYNIESNNITIAAATKTVTVTGNVNSTGANVGAATSKAQTFKGWTGSNGTTPQTSVTIAKGSTENKSYTANWTAVAMTLPTVTKTGYTCAWYSTSGNSGGSKVGDSGGTYTPTANSASAITVYARCTPVGYTISYTLNGGANNSNNPTSYTIESNAITLAAATKTVTVTGNVNSTGANVGASTSKAQTFKGWTGSNGTTPQTSVTIAKGSTENKSYTANWTAVAMTLPTVTKNGYTCAWYSTSGTSGGSKVGDSGGSYTPTANSASAITVYARCTPVTYTISYSLNNGTNGNGNPTSYTIESNAITLAAATKTVTVTGNVNNTGATVGGATSKAQTFAGWTGSNGTTAQTSVTIAKGSTGNKNYTANWTGVAMTLPTVTKNGYTCAWYSTSGTSGGSKVGDSGGSYTPAATSATAITVYARCTPVTYTISYTLNGGANNSNNPTSYNIESNAITIAAATKTVTVTGNVNNTGATVGGATSKAQTFAGWTGSNGTTAQTSVTIAKGSTGNKNYTANWTGVSMTLPTVTKNGYTCAWYSTSGTSGGSKVGDSGGSYTPAANSASAITVYARCTPVTYTIGYTLNGGANGSGNPANYTIESNAITIAAATKTVTVTGNANNTGATVGAATSKAQTFKGWTGSNGTTAQTSVTIAKGSTGNKSYTANWTAVAMTLPTVTKNGYTCAWYSTSGNSGGSKVGDSGGAYTPTANSASAITVYARCTPVTYTISYSLNNGTNGNGNPTSYNIESNNITLAAATKTVTITGNVNGSGATIGAATSKAQTFKGWTGSNGTTAQTSVTIAKGSTGNKSYTANWTPVAMTLPTVTKTGYICAWYDTSGNSGGNKVGDSGGTYTPAATSASAITVYARCTPNNVLEAVSDYTYQDDPFLSTTITREKIESVAFTNSISGHTANGTNCWDVGETKNGTVLAWVTDSNSNGLYEMTIGGTGFVAGNANSSKLFDNLSNTTKITGINNFNTSNVTNMSRMFRNLRKLTTLDVSTFNTTKVTNMKMLFTYDESLTNLNVSNWNTSNVTDMEQMFSSVDNITTLNVSNWNTSKAINLYGMFDGMSKLTSLNINSWNVSNVEDFGSIFYGLDSITTMNLSSWNTSKATKMGFMFGDMDNLTSITWGSGWNMSNVTDIRAMFHTDPKLTTVNVSGWNTAKVANMYGVFSGDTGLTSLNVSNWNTSNVTMFNFMFRNVTNLSSLDVSKWNTSSATSTYSMFSYMQKMTTLNLKNWNTSKVTDMSFMFYEMSNLTTVYVGSGWNTSNVSSSTDMFKNTTKIKGGSGTTYSSSYIDKTRAKIDGGSSSRGYFTSAG